VKGSSELVGNLDHPLGPYLYGISVMHCMSESLTAEDPTLRVQAEAVGMGRKSRIYTEVSQDQDAYGQQRASHPSERETSR
jgi:hypothetical protein